ncbi:MAG: prenyltransferase [Candidatus Omnitrophica bacterium]|nr:prenyltransferase [Candidatus Omnitrophota bacterium]MDD5236404.1 prenyltransferase [Candidatus Omnitrophota bacterium]MDD5611287.1 prenyltransferase [Candidatus Omnitrophota bacterium]
MFKNIVRALRLPFIAASVLPFVFGSLIEKGFFQPLGFLCGLLAVVTTHLSANLLNDYADSKSGADWQDKKFYGLFGGSKLIQEKIFSEKFYLALSMIMAAVSFICVLALAKIMDSIFVAGIYLAILILSWCYSHKPLQFSYHALGEVFIFILFGPAVVMGGYFIQTKIFPDLKSFLLSLPFGFFTAAILFSNEVPDYSEDRAAGKFNWVSIFKPQRSYLLYSGIVLCAFLSVALNIYYGYLGVISFFSFFLIFFAGRAAVILKNNYADKTKLLASSRLTILVQNLAGIILILDLLR